MKKLIFTSCILILTLAANTFAGKPGFCDGETPLSWSLYDLQDDMTLYAISSDGRGTYTQGVDGVINSVIQAGSKDATLIVTGPGKNGNGRSFRVQIPNPIPDSYIYGGPPSFAGQGSFLTPANAQFTISNVLGYPVLTPGQPATFYTRAVGRFSYSDGNLYRWASAPNFEKACPGDFPCVPDTILGSLPSEADDPFETAWVKVTYTPATGSNPDYWDVEPTIVPQTSTLWQTTKGKPITTHFGQYSIPFKVRITALCPLPN